MTAAVPVPNTSSNFVGNTRATRHETKQGTVQQSPWRGDRHETEDGRGGGEGRGLLKKCRTPTITSTCGCFLYSSAVYVGRQTSPHVSGASYYTHKSMPVLLFMGKVSKQPGTKRVKSPSPLSRAPCSFHEPPSYRANKHPRTYKRSQGTIQPHENMSLQIFRDSRQSAQDRKPHYGLRLSSA